jgi:serine/threonine protein kinase/type II secretory pathway pseudopilin PulG
MIDMSTETSRIQVIFEQAVGLRADERMAFLDECCAGAPDIRMAVERLIGEHEKLMGDLDAPTTPLGPPSMEESPDEAPGTVIGRYRLLQQLGEGGFGRVYQAEQLEPVRREVALKVIKLGMDTRQVMARFEAERQALAMMDHPGIARVFDAGATSSGRPYFVMELVRGVSITRYCDDNRLTTRERLELFVKVCSAVQHAHQKGVIHRDLKPGNILVTMHDGVPIPKVIDFGIAKATSVRLTERTIFTESRQFVGTPEYMSPEQAEMSGLDVDTRADVYSLGVILYELLVGRTPFDSEALRGQGLEALSTVIRETDPPKPSVRYATLGDERAAVARQRGADADRHGRMLRGDLEWIVMRAIEKSRMRRYQTAASLADDVERYLRDEPVEAGPPSALYRLSKFARRRRGTLITAGVAIALVLVSLAGTSIGLVRARAAEAAQREQLAIALEERATAQELMRTSQQWLTEFTREIERIAAGADPATFGEGLMLSRFDFEGAPREETIQLAATAQSSANAIAALLRSVGEARARAGEAEGRLSAIGAFVRREFPDSDPRGTALHGLVGATYDSPAEGSAGADDTDG